MHKVLSLIESTIPSAITAEAYTFLPYTKGTHQEITLALQTDFNKAPIDPKRQSYYLNRFNATHFLYAPYLSYLDKEDVDAWICRDQTGKILGFCEHHPDHEIAILVLWDYRRRGIGTKLMQKMAQDLCLKGVPFLKWQVSLDNTASYALCTKLLQPYLHQKMLPSTSNCLDHDVNFRVPLPLQEKPVFSIFRDPETSSLPHCNQQLLSFCCSLL
jgi:GNAT superfamily N-acetyltransferase